MVLPLIAGGIAAAARFAAPIVSKGLAKLLGFAITKPKTTIALGLGVPAAVGALTVPSVRRKVGKIISPRERFKAGKEFGERLTGTKPSDGGDLIKSGAKAAGILGAVVGGVAAAKLIKGKLPKKEKVITTPEQLVPGRVLPSMEPLGPVVKDPEEKIVQPVPSIINRINVTPIVNVRINQSRKFINQQLLIRA